MKLNRLLLQSLTLCVFALGSRQLAAQVPPLLADPSPLMPVDKWEPMEPQIPVFAPQLRAPLANLSNSAWTSIGPTPLAVSSPVNVNTNVSGRITGVAADPTDSNTIYIATAGGGVWKTVNGGTSWTPLTDTQRTLSMGAIAVAPSNGQVIYAGTGEANNSADSNFGRGILRSSDGGSTWTLATGPANAFDRLATSQITVDPTNANIAYVAMADLANNGLIGVNAGIYKTTDGGVTWVSTTTAIDATSPWSAVIIDRTIPSTLYSAHGLYYGHATNGIYKTTNSGSAWPLLGAAVNGTGTGRFSLALAPSNDQVLYAIASSPFSYGLLKMLRSDNGGASFNDLTSTTPNPMGGQGWYDQWVNVDPTNPTVVYIAGAAGPNSILRSTTSGANWTDISSGGSPNFSSPHADHHASTFDASGRLIIGTDGGIWRLDNPATNGWTNLNGNLCTIQFQGVGLHPTNPNVAVGGSQDNGTEIYTGSLAWLETDGGDGGFAKFSSTNGARVYHQIPRPSFGSNFFRRSDDTGNTWVTKTTAISADFGQNFYAPFSVDPGNGDRVLYGTNRVWETTNGGDSWTPISVVGGNGFNNTSTAYVDTIGIAPSDVSTLYAATGGTFASSSKIFVTTNHGASWTEHDLPAGNGRVNEIQVEPANAMIAYAVVNQFNANGHVFRTTNGGTTWTNISGTGGGALPDLPVWSIQVDNSTTPSTLYIGSDDGVYFSVDTGASWRRAGSGLPNCQVFQLDFNKNLHILAAATHGRGAWEIQTPLAAAVGATLVVTKTADTNDGVCDADCSLREALAVAASDGLPDTIVFNIPANSPGCVGTDCTITLGSTLAPASDSGLLTTINGATGSNRITVSGNSSVRILDLYQGANLSIDGVNFTAGNSNTAAGIYIFDGRLTLTNCALFNNNNPGSPGGAINCEANCILNLTNVTIANNTAVGANGIRNSGTVTARNCTIANNSGGFVGGGISTGGTFTIGNSIIAQNSAIIGPDGAGTFTSLGYNIVGNGSSANGFTATGDQVEVNPQLLALADNGGPTRTCALQSNSPAINAGGTTAPAYDQRYLLRNGASDIGAYEFNGLTPSLKVTAITHLATGHIFLQGLGVANAPHTILWSSAPSSGFSYLGLATSDGTGTVQYDDAGAVGANKRFYRLTFP